MKRTFSPSEFAFEQSDLDTPASFLATLNRMDSAKIATPGYASKLFQAVTNQNSFDNDEWIDLCMDVGHASKLISFSNELGDWHEKNNVKQLFLPDIMADSYAHSAANNGWVHQIVDGAGLTPGAEPSKRPKGEHQVQASLTNFSM